MGLINNLNPAFKLKLIKRLSTSIEKDAVIKSKKMEKAFGAWEDSIEAENIIISIRNSRTFNREIRLF
ncbi:MAG: hypothetical protein JRJ44_06915 [Deltaproteobacteria bacterium]|nr:hypothetical protein [Deltaproteobacteria bacterium]